MLTDNIILPTDIQQLISTELAWNYHVIPYEKEGNKVTFLTSEQHRSDTLLDELEIMTGYDVNFEVIDEDLFVQTLGKYYRKSGAVETNNLTISQGSKSSDFLLKIIYEAKALGSSDIHIEKYDDAARIRIRIDGILIEKYVIEVDEYPELVNKIKIRSNLDITEKRLPQDGRINLEEFDIRVSVLPTLHGEKIVMRILSKDASRIDLNQLGLSEFEKSVYLEGVKKTNGIILISGPTGSGKTTTLYATLKLLNEEKRNIVTVEDPIEYTIKGINQVQLKEKIGLTFSAALRSFLRQDPDIIMLGEIRDVETAQMAIRAAQTGHLVLSTIHTNSAWGTIARLIDMGLPPFLLASTINTTVAQRLVKILCKSCKRQTSVKPYELPHFYRQRAIETCYEPVGCEHCHYSGYSGRRAIYEVINIDHDLADKIKEGQLRIDTLLEEKKVVKLNEKAFELFEKGETSLEEVYALLLNI